MTSSECDMAQITLLKLCAASKVPIKLP